MYKHSKTTQSTIKKYALSRATSWTRRFLLSCLCMILLLFLFRSWTGFHSLSWSSSSDAYSSIMVRSVFLYACLAWIGQWGKKIQQLKFNPRTYEGVGGWMLAPPPSTTTIMCFLNFSKTSLHLHLPFSVAVRISVSLPSRRKRRGGRESEKAEGKLEDLPFSPHFVAPVPTPHFDTRLVRSRCYGYEIWCISSR